MQWVLYYLNRAWLPAWWMILKQINNPIWAIPRKRLIFDSKYTATFNLYSRMFQPKAHLQYGKSKYGNDFLIDSQSEKDYRLIITLGLF